MVLVTGLLPPVPNHRLSAVSSRVRARLVPEGSTSALSGHDLVHDALSDICDRCSDAFDLVLEHLKDRSLKARYSEYSILKASHHTNLTELKASAQHCPLCQLFLAHAESCDVSRHALRLSQWLRLLRRAKDFQVEFWIVHDKAASPRVSDIHYRFDDRLFSPGVWFDFAVDEENEITPFHDRLIPTCPPLDLAHRWIENCYECHTSLCGELGGLELPTRLVDVGDDSQEPKLVITDELDTRSGCDDGGLYVALSHCWGKRMPRSRTTMETIERYRQAIPFASLEKTFQDAITVTRGLGYKYLWIDTLCIVQDSQEDWQRECSRMATVYAHAAATVAAAASPDAFSGIMNERPQAQGPFCEVSLDNKQLLLIGRSSKGMLDFLPKPDYDSILNDRAWAFQERLLSSRVLHIGTDRMAFECRNGTQYETSRPYDGTFVSQRMTAAKLPWLTEAPDAPRFKTGELDSVTSFYDLVGAYTTCKMAKRDDILPAFSGIARRYQQWTGDEYLAGLWKSTLIQGLCWERARPPIILGMRVDIPVNDTIAADGDLPTFTVPSWSWASLNRQVNFRSGSQVEEDVISSAEVLGGRVQLVGHDPFGQVDGGEVTLRGWTRGYRFGIIYNMLRRLSSLIPALQAWFTPWLDFIPDDPTGPPWGEEATFLLLSDTSYERDEGSDKRRWDHWHALALQSVDEEQGGTFRRIGYMIGLGKSSWIREVEIKTVRII